MHQRHTGRTPSFRSSSGSARVGWTHGVRSYKILRQGEIVWSLERRPKHDAMTKERKPAL